MIYFINIHYFIIIPEFIFTCNYIHKYVYTYIYKGKRHTLQEITTYLIESSKPEIKMPIIPKKNRPHYWTERRKAILKSLKNMNNIFSRNKMEENQVIELYHKNHISNMVIEEKEEEEEINEVAEETNKIKYYGKRGKQLSAATASKKQISNKTSTKNEEIENRQIDNVGNDNDSARNDSITTDERKVVRFADTDSISDINSDGNCFTQFSIVPESFYVPVSAAGTNWIIIF